MMYERWYDRCSANRGKFEDVEAHKSDGKEEARRSRSKIASSLT